VLVLADLGFLFDMVFKLCIVIPTEQPTEDCFLNLLVVLFFKEIIVEKLHGSEHKQLSALRRHIERTDRAVSWETDWATRHDGHSWAIDVERGAIWVDELKASILISFDQVVLVDCVALSILASL
jgi:hypothetical protein